MRECGGCVECCFVLGVREIPKEPLSACPHACAGKGCAIYDTRPEPCRADQCLWLEGRAPGLTDEDRPDKLGMVFFLRPQQTLGRPTVFAYEVRENAALAPHAQEVITAMGRRLPVAIVMHETHATLVRAPDDIRDRLAAEATTVAAHPRI